MNYEEAITIQKNKFCSGIQRTKENRNQWNGFLVQATNIFQILKNEGENQKLFENLYFYDSSTDQAYQNSTHILQFYWGNHPTGLTKKELDEFNEVKKISHICEQGGKLVFSQTAQGEVIVSLYPMESEALKRNEEFIIADLYKSPSEIIEKKIHRAITDFFSYSQCSSIYGSPNTRDWIRVYWLLFRDLRNRDKNTLLIVKHFYELIKGLLPLVIGVLIGVYTIK